MPYMCETAQDSYWASLRPSERVETRSRENVVKQSRVGGSRGGHRQEACAPASVQPACAHTGGKLWWLWARERIALPISTAETTEQRRRSHFFSLFHHIMAANNVSRCVRFGDGTPPLCHASNLPQGQVCQQCDNEHRSARDVYEGSGPEARRALLLKENQNLRLMSTFASFELEAETRCTEAWQQAVRAKISERDMLIKQRDQAE